MKATHVCFVIVLRVVCCCYCYYSIVKTTYRIGRRVRVRYGDVEHYEDSDDQVDEHQAGRGKAVNDLNSYDKYACAINLDKSIRMIFIVIDIV